MRTLSLAMAVCFLFGCTDSGCTAMEPIPGGFPLEDRVENAVQMRLTPSGIDFLEENVEEIIGTVAGGSLLFPIPPSSIDAPVGTLDICPAGDCYVNLDIITVELEPNSTRDSYEITVEVQVWTATETGARAPVLVDYGIRCDANLDTRDSGASELPVSGAAQFRIQGRTRYTSLELDDFDATSEFEDDDITITGHDSIWDDLACAAIDVLFKGFIMDMIAEELNAQIEQAMAEFTCETCDVTGICPSGSSCVDGVCMRGSDCVPSTLGIENRVHLGQAMASFSPGMNAQLDLLMAAGGYADVTTDGGLSLGMFGGAEPVPARTCAPRRDMDPSIMSSAPVADSLYHATTCPSGAGGNVHTILVLSETYLNRFSYGMHQSGGLCMGMGAEVLPPAMGMIISMVPSARNFVMSDTAPLGIELRPSEPPRFELDPDTGDGPMLTVSIPDLYVDFLIWGNDRYSRIFTVALDLGLDVAVGTTGGLLEPSITALRCENLSVDNSGVVLQSEIENTESALCPTLESMIGMIGDLGPFELPPLAGFNLVIPDGGIGYLDEGSEEFLIVCSSLGMAKDAGEAPEPRPVIRPEARILSLELPPLEELSPENDSVPLPRLTLEIDAEGADGEPVEFRARVDSGFWTRWTTDREVVVEKRILQFDARHEVEVQARIVDEPATMGSSPTTLEVIVDRTPPTVEVELVDETARVIARDLISASEEIVLGWRPLYDELWTPVPADGIQVPYDASEIEIQAMDEAGNVSVSRHALRGRIPDSGGSGCDGCSVSNSPLRGTPVLIVLVLLSLVIARRR